MALVVSLLDTTLIRIGNRQYLRENNSYGLTTLRNRHVQVQGSTVRFQFRGKRGVEHDVSLRDRRLARLIKRCLELPGQTLFQYLDEQGQRHAVGSSEVNQFLQQLTGADFTAKDYRTWAGSALAPTCCAPGLATGKRGPPPGCRYRPAGGHAPGQYTCGVSTLLYPPGGAGALSARPTGHLAQSQGAPRPGGGGSRLTSLPAITRD